MMTAQVHENLILNGKKMTMACAPPVPENHPEIVLNEKFSEEKGSAKISFFARPRPEVGLTVGPDPDGLSDEFDPIIFSTACWRRYIGTWEIKDDKLFLIDLHGKYKKTTSRPIFADWFSGTLKIPMGPLVKYVHSDFASQYAQELILEIKEGRVISQKIIKNTPGAGKKKNVRSKIAKAISQLIIENTPDKAK